ncbi:hypothetical protein NQU36_27205, partial [Escherichia coli]|uniref:hypothetical protein n=1 Tax=Escherichia coli TaxID=562 RepID=UPI0021192EA9
GPFTIMFAVTKPVFKLLKPSFKSDVKKKTNWAVNANVKTAKLQKKINTSKETLLTKYKLLCIKYTKSIT